MPVFAQVADSDRSNVALVNGLGRKLAVNRMEELHCRPKPRFAPRFGNLMKDRVDAV
jgi:hypothetical protein